MAVIRPVYRLTLYKPRSQDPTETEPLVPAAGAPHGDAFRVSTHRLPADTSGTWKPYLEMPRGGRRSRVDPIKKKSDVGSMTAELADKKLAADDDSERWLSAFIGDGNGVDQLKGLRAQWEESLDGGFTFQPFWAGRTQDVESRGRLGVRITMRDEVDRFKVPLFVGRPHSSITNAFQAPLLPYGRMTLISGIGAKKSLQAPQDTFYLDATAIGSWGGYPQAFELNHVETQKDHWLLTQALWDLAIDRIKVPLGPHLLYFDGDSVQLEVESGGTVLGRFAVRYLMATEHGDLRLVRRIAVEELPASDIDYVAYPAVSTVYGVALVTPAHKGPSEASPLFVGAPVPINVVTLIANILDGYFGRLDENGDPLDAIRRRTASFSALASQIPYTFRDKISEETTVEDWLSEHLLEPFDLALIPDAEGYLDLVSLARPSTIVAPSSITDSEIVAEPDAESWRHVIKDIVNAVEIKTRYWWLADLEAVLAEGEDNRDHLVNPPPGLIDIIDYPPIHILSADQGEESREFDFGLKVHETTLVGLVPGDALEYGRKHALDLFARFGAGAHYVTYRRRRVDDDGVAIDPSCDIGARRSLETRGVPDPATHSRGVSRLGICIERQPDPGWVDLTFLDEGPNEQADEPTLGSLVLADGTVVGTIVDPVHSVVVDSPAMNAAGDPIRIDVAVTADGAGQPATNSSLWKTVTDPGYRPDGLTPLVIRGQPNGQLVWVRGRSEPISGSARLPSDWVFPDPTSVLLNALTPPSGLGVSNIGPTAADLAWTNGEADLSTVVLVDDVVVETLPPGSTSYRLTGMVPGQGLTPNTNYDVSVVHVDAFGGYTAAATANFSTLNSGASLPRPVGLQQLVPSAITLALFAADTGIPMVLQRAPDSAGAPDLGSIETIAAALPGTTTRYTDAQPVDPAVWWYRLAHGSGAVVGPFTDWVSAIAESGETPDPTYIRPTVEATPSETSTDGTLDLTITDPIHAVTAVEFRARQGTGSWSSWLADTAPYSATVPIAAGGTSQIGWRVLGYDETGTVVTLASGTETFGASTDILSAPVLTSAPATSTFPNSRELKAGTNVTFDDSVAGERTINASGTGGGGGSTSIELATTVGARLVAVSDAVEVMIDDDYEIIEAEIQADVAGDAVVDVLRATDAGFPTFTSIAASAKPTLSSQQRVIDETLTGWTTALAAGDTLRFVLDSLSTATVVTVALKLQKTADVQVSAPRILTIVRTMTVAGEIEDIPIDDDATILEAEIQGDTSGNAVVEVYRATDAGYPTFARIDGSGVPTLSSEQRVKDSTLSGWNVNLAAGDTLRYKLASFGAGISRVTMALKVRIGAVTGVGGFGGTVTPGTVPLATGAQTLGDSEIVNGTDNIEVGRSLLIEKGLVHPPTVVSSNATLTHAHYLVIVTANATINLPPAASSTGRAYQIVPVGGVTATVDPNGAELIDGAATLALTSGALIACDGTGWHAVAKAAGSGGGGGSVGIYDPFKAEASPSSQDDDFDTDLSKWTQVSWDSHTVDVNTTKPSALYIAMPASGGGTLDALMQALPAGDFVFCLPFEILTRGGNYPYIAAVLSNGTTPGAGSQVVNAVVAQGPFAQNQYIQNFVNWAYSSSIADSLGYGRSYGWLRWRRSSTTYYAGISSDGRKWIEQVVAVGFTPTHFGLGLSNSSSVPCYVTIPCARFISGSATHLFGGLV